MPVPKAKLKNFVFWFSVLRQEGAQAKPIHTMHPERRPFGPRQSLNESYLPSGASSLMWKLWHIEIPLLYALAFLSLEERPSDMQG